jgi:uncharacterized membrane protein YfcA
MTTPEILWIAAGALVGGFMNGLTGFGLAMGAIGFWLEALSPATVASLAALTAVVAHAQSISMVAHAIDVKRLAPFIVGGLLGIPVGTWLLAGINEDAFRFWIGAVIVVYCIIRLTGLLRLSLPPSHVADGVVGVGGGILGALAGLSGALPAIWAGTQNWSKDERRAVFQPFNMSILAVSVVAHFAAGLFTPELLYALAVAIPLVLVGAWSGKALYRRLGDHHFDRVVLLVLLFAGLSLVVSNLLQR